jgi:hypothetical protein
VRLLDVNDEVPRFSSPFGYNQVVNENLEVGDEIITVGQQLVDVDVDTYMG